MEKVTIRIPSAELAELAFHLNEPPYKYRLRSKASIIEKSLLTLLEKLRRGHENLVFFTEEGGERYLKAWI